MTRISFHGPRRPPIQKSLQTRMYEALFGPQKLVIKTFHFPRETKRIGSGYNRNAQALHKAIPGSGSGRKTHVYARKPRTMLELGVISLGGVVVLGCVVFWAVSRDHVVITNRERTMAFTWEFERKRFGEKVTHESDESDGLDIGPLLNPEKDIRAKVVAEITRRILNVMQREYPEVYEKLEWKVEVRQNPQINAFYQPGGRLVILTGLIDMVVKSEIEGRVNSAIDSLAMVIAHELAHGMARHGMEKLSWLPIQIPFLLLTPDTDVLYESFNLIFKLPHSRLLESEADIIGLRLMAYAGFDAHNAPEFFKILNADPKFLEWTSTHPVGETRAAEVATLLASEPEIYKSRVFNDGYAWPDLKSYYLNSMKAEAVKKGVALQMAEKID